MPTLSLVGDHLSAAGRILPVAAHACQLWTRAVKRRTVRARAYLLLLLVTTAMGMVVSELGPPKARLGLRASSSRHRTGPHHTPGPSAGRSALVPRAPGA
jgi:hypothetical protein